MKMVLFIHSFNHFPYGTLTILNLPIFSQEEEEQNRMDMAFGGF